MHHSYERLRLYFMRLIKGKLKPTTLLILPLDAFTLTMACTPNWQLTIVSFA